MRILVRGTNWIGDAVMTIPAIRELRRSFPDAQLTLQTRTGTKGVLQQSGLFDEVITPDGLIEQIRAIRQRHFDLAIIFPNSFSSAFAVWAGGVKKSFGYASENRSFLLTDPVQIPEWKDTRHEVYYYLELVSAAQKAFFGRSIEPDSIEPRLDVGKAARENARDILRRLGAVTTQKTVAIAAGSTNSRAKRWIPERFAQLNDRLRAELNCNVVLMGSPDDREVSHEVASLASHPPFDLTGETNIETATAILGEIDLLISNDMGLAHLAPAVGTETIVIFGPTNQLTTRPFSDRASIVSANVECAPCMLRDCPIDHRCMTRVSVDEVFVKAKEKLHFGF